VDHKWLMGVVCVGMLGAQSGQAPVSQAEPALRVAAPQAVSDYGYSPVFAARYVGSYQGNTPLCTGQTRVDLYRGGELMWQCATAPDQWQTGTWQTNQQGRALRLNADQVVEVQPSAEGLRGRTPAGQTIDLVVMANTTL
jgi:hypothetical protein